MRSIDVGTNCKYHKRHGPLSESTSQKVTGLNHYRAYRYSAAKRKGQKTIRQHPIQVSSGILSFPHSIFTKILIGHIDNNYLMSAFQTVESRFEHLTIGL